MGIIQITAFVALMGILIALTVVSVRMEKVQRPASQENGHEYQLPDGTWVEV